MLQAPRLNPKRLAAVAVLCVLALMAATLPSSASAAPLPPAGTDVLDVTGTVGVVSRLGSETFAITGTATIDRAAPHMEGSVQVVDMELVALDLTGTSLVGDIAITQNLVIASPGTLAGIMPPPQSFPASAALNIYFYAVAPANPQPTVTRYNTTPLYMVRMESAVQVPLEVWPPHDVTFVADTTPCVPLLPTLPLDACVTSLSVTLQALGVGGVSELTAARRTDRAMDEDAAITPLEGVLAGAAAVTGAVVIAGAGWYLRRRIG